MSELQFFATAPLGMAALLRTELAQLGIGEPQERRSGVAFNGPLAMGYRACLFSRLANRVLLRLATFDAADANQLYDGVIAIPWQDHLRADQTLAVDFHSLRSKIDHTLFGAQKVKDAIVDQFRTLGGVRPSVRLDRPDLRINVFVADNQATLSLDLSGESLHKRGYRLEGGAAPLKENLAAAMLYKAGWPELAKEGGALLDPMCGSGTLIIEAAMMAADSAPGLLRESSSPASQNELLRPRGGESLPLWGFSHWLGHDPLQWQRLLDEATARHADGLAGGLPAICGTDHDPIAVNQARANAQRAGLDSLLSIEQASMQNVTAAATRGLFITNPPYGQRMGESEQLPVLFEQLGKVLRERFQGWRAALLTPDPELGFRVGYRSTGRHSFKNGAIDCKLLIFEITQHRQLRGGGPRRSAQHLAEAQMLSNRLRKNIKRLEGWLKSEGIDCYRIYDADIPELAFAVDVYTGEVEGRWMRMIHAQEYAPPPGIDEQSAERRRQVMTETLSEVFQVESAQVVLKTRERQRGKSQYGRMRNDLSSSASKPSIEMVVKEHGCRLIVNLSDYLDTGLFLDHRPLRRRLAQQAGERRFLNLFAYTGTATVHAAVGGAHHSVSVDMSHNYLAWAERNFRLNGIDSRHHLLVTADCTRWLEEAIGKNERFDLILLDPPTFSNSKRMVDVLDIQRDHPSLIERCMTLLSSNGVLYFSTNRRRFKLDPAFESSPGCVDISQATIARDFSQNRQIHRCWRFQNAR